MSLKTMPGSGKSGTSRIFAWRSIGHQPDARWRRSRQNSSCESSCASSASGSSSWRPAWRRSGLRERSAGATSCSSSAGLAVGGRPEGPQVPRRDAVARRAWRRRARCRRRSAVGARRPRRRGCEQAELLELARQLRRDRRARSQSSARSSSSSGLAEPGRRAAGGAPSPGLGAASSCRITRSGRNSSRCRRRIVSQPLDVVLAEEPVAALRAPRREQPLVLEVADLRDRDVGELRLQAAADASRS